MEFKRVIWSSRGSYGVQEGQVFNLAILDLDMYNLEHSGGSGQQFTVKQKM